MSFGYSIVLDKKNYIVRKCCGQYRQMNLDKKNLNSFEEIKKFKSYTQAKKFVDSLLKEDNSKESQNAKNTKKRVQADGVFSFRNL